MLTFSMPKKKGTMRRRVSLSTADLCDSFGDSLQYARGGVFAARGFGSRGCRFQGRVRTVQCLEDNSMVRKAAYEPGSGCVLVVDGGGSMQRALCGDQLAAKLAENGWEGLVINGCIRDAAAIAKIDIGIQALGTIARKTEKRGAGVMNIPVEFAGVRFVPGSYLVSDEDGIVVGEMDALLSKL